MSISTPRRGRLSPAAGLCALYLILGASSAGAQELPLKRALPGVDPFSCPEIAAPTPPGPEEEAQARVLGSNADQALILGDQVRARDLLARATELDPSSPELAYRYGRSLAELGEAAEAIQQFCRAINFGAVEAGMDDVQSRLDDLVATQNPRIPDIALSHFSNGITQSDLGNPLAAIDAFTRAHQTAPTWADPIYNRAVMKDQEGDIAGAVADFQEYLSLRPEGVDAIAVSQRIGQLQSSGPLPSAGTTLTLGMLIPGMGQFYSGRAVGGFTVLALAGGALAAGVLVEKIDVYCVGSATSGGDCPDDRFIREEKTQPYLKYGLAAAGVVTLIGALEAFFDVRGRGPGEAGDFPSVDAGPVQISGPAVSASGGKLEVSLLRISY